jgi:hypothetical protein
LLKKFHTLRRVFLTYGVAEVIRLIYRKIFQTKESGTFAEGVFFESSTRFMTTIANNPSEAQEFFSLNNNSRTGFFGPIYDLGPELSESLVGVLMVTKPTLVIETGVAAGKSTNLILNQLRLSDQGRLVSIDVTINVGELVEPQNRFLWDLEVLPSLLRRHRFESLLRKHSDAQIFLHDSDHSVEWQLFEIKKVTEVLRHVSYILVDDIQPSVASFLISKFGIANCFFFDELGRKKSLIVRTAVQA